MNKFLFLFVSFFTIAQAQDQTENQFPFDEASVEHYYQTNKSYLEPRLELITSQWGIQPGNSHAKALRDLRFKLAWADYCYNNYYKHFKAAECVLVPKYEEAVQQLFIMIPGLDKRMSFEEAYILIFCVALLQV